MYLPPLLNPQTDPDEILGVAPFGRRTDPRLPGDPGSPPRGVPPLLKGRGDFSGKGPLRQGGGRGEGGVGWPHLLALCLLFGGGRGEWGSGMGWLQLPDPACLSSIVLENGA